MQKNIVYLFGAGATHAEILNAAADDVDDNFKQKYGLLISDLSDRVMRKAHQKFSWFRDHENVFTSRGSFNIELLISLFEANRIPDHVINNLKKLVKDDIKRVLSTNRKRQFYLHKALMELHSKIADKENLLGIISLNYDDVLDEAYLKYYEKINYSLPWQKEEVANPPLLKLHGSFTWENIRVDGKIKHIPIIPIGMNKNYLFPPYNFIWGKAYDLLTKCDVLRVVGCALSQADIGLIDLLFKAHSDRNKSFKIKVIDFQPSEGHHSIKNNYGFFPDIVDPNPEYQDANDPEETLIADPGIYKRDQGNPFKIWLKSKIIKMKFDAEDLKRSVFIKKCFD
jgi:hypothetical protein